MLKHYKYYLLHKLIKDPIVAAQVYHMIYRGGQPPKKEFKIEMPSFSESVVKSIPVSKSPAVKSETDELMDKLTYLKSKQVKTKQDRDSIGIIEAVLKNKT